MRASRVLALGAAVLAAACAETATQPALDAPVLDVAADHTSAVRTYEVTITNLTSGQPLTPPIAAVHNGRLDIFTPGRPASTGIAQLAENGNGGPLSAELAASPHVSTIGGGAAPVFPGGSLTFTIDASGKDRFLSWYSMLICTNDGFTGDEQIVLPRRVGQSFHHRMRAWDAGSEINTEDFADMVPPCAAITGVPTMDPGTGMSDPALAENGRIRRHRGIEGIDDLLVDLHGWKGAVASITVTRTN